MRTGTHRRPRRTRGALTLALTLLIAGSTAGTAAAAPAAGYDLAGFGTAGVSPLAHAHSHNDYDAPRPLLDAVERGYTSIEVDVVLVGTRLLVGHDAIRALAGGASLTALYLEPLARWVRTNGGHVFGPHDGPLTLLVDVKSGSRRTWAALAKVLTRYRDMLTTFTPTAVTPGAVTVVVSGNRPSELLTADGERLAALDGRLADLEPAQPAPAARIPMVSVRWGEVFRWNGTGAMPADQRARMEALATAAHTHGRRLRFFDTPARNAVVRSTVWRAELDAGVDLLNVDDLAAGQEFLLRYQHPAAGSVAGHRLAGRRRRTDAANR